VVLVIYAICAALAISSIVLAGGSGPLYAFIAIVIASGLFLLVLTFRAGTDEALEASSYADDEAGATSPPADDDDGSSDSGQTGNASTQPTGEGGGS
jgi:hypothetical protein